MPRTEEPPQQPSAPARVNVPLQQAIEAILTDRPIAYHAVLARALGSVTAGILLSQLLYWTPRAQDQEGWFWKTQEEIYQETALSRREQETARRVLLDAGLLEERRAGMPAKVHFRVNMRKLGELIGAHVGRPSSSGSPDRRGQYGGKRQSSMAESANQVGGVPPNKYGAFVQTITETTTETTQRSQQRQQPVADPVGKGSDVVVDRMMKKEGVQSLPEAVSGASTTPDVDLGLLENELIKRGVGALHARQLGQQESPRALGDRINRLDALLHELTSRGVATEAARRLVADHSPEQIRTKTQLFDWLKEHRPQLVEKSPGGWIFAAISKDYQAPMEYVEAQEKEERKAHQRERLAREEAQAMENLARQMAVPPKQHAVTRLRFKDMSARVGKRPQLEGQERAEFIEKTEREWAAEQAQWFAEHPEFAHILEEVQAASEQGSDDQEQSLPDVSEQVEPASRGEVKTGHWR
jgi:hypothetical protein